MLEDRRLMTADTFLEGLQAFQQTLNGLSQHEQFAETRQLVGESFGDQVNIGQLFGEEFVSPLLPAADEGMLLTLLAEVSSSNPRVTVTTSTQPVADGEELQVELVWNYAATETQRPIDIDFTGLRETNLAADVTQQLNLHATFGLSPAGADRAFFVDVHDLSATTQLNNATHDGAALRGFAGIDLPMDPTLQYAADLSVEFTNPDGDAQDRLSTLELLGNSLHVLTNVVTLPSSQLSLNIPLQVTVGDYTTEGSSPQLALTSNDPFAEEQPPFAWNADAAELAMFDTVNALDVAGRMSQIAGWLPGITNVGPLNQALPFAASRSVRDVVDIAEMYAAQVGNLLQSSAETTNFDSIQELAELLQATTLDYDPGANILSFGWQLQRNFATEAANLDVDFDVPSADAFAGLSGIAVDASASLDLVLGIDLTPLGEGFSLTDTTSLDTLNGGLGVQTQAGDDMRITLRDGTPHDFDLSGASTIGDVLDILQVPGSLESAISPSGRSLVLTDLTNGPNTFAVDFLGSSLAAGWLGIWGSDEDLDGVLTGVALHGDRLTDHFFVQSGALDGTIAFSGDNLNADMQVLGFEAMLGDGTLSLNGSFSALLADPGTQAADNRITINELGAAMTGGPAELALLVPAATLAGSASLGFNDVVIPSLPAGALNDDASLLISVPDISDLPSAELTHTLNITDVPNVDAADLLTALTQAAGFLDDAQGLAGLAQHLPVVDQPFSDFLDIASQLQDVFDQIDPNAYTPASLENALPNLLGIDHEDFSLEFDEVGQVLNISLDYQPTELRHVALDLDLAGLLEGEVPALAGISSIVDAAGEAEFEVNVGADLHLQLGIDLSDPTSPTPFLYDSTSLVLTLLVDDSSLNFQAAAGPLGLFVEGGSVTFDVDGAGPQNIPGTFTIDLPEVAGDRYTFGQAIGSAELTVVAGVDVHLPIAFPLETNELSPNLEISISSLSDFFADVPGAVVVTTPDLTAELGDFDLLENLHLVVDGIDWMLNRVEKGLNSRVLDVTLPFLGDRLQHSAAFIGDLREGFLADVGDFLEDHPATPATVQQALFKYLGPGPDGINILSDRDNDGAVTLADVNYIVDDPDPSVPGDEDVLFEFSLGRDVELAGGDINFDIGLDALGLEVDTDVALNMFYEWDVAFGISAADGFYLDTSSDAEMRIGLQASIDDAEITGRLGFLELKIQDDLTEPTALTGTFSVDLQDPSGDDKLTMSELGPGSTSIADVFHGTLDAQADVNLHLRLSFGGSEVFPSLVSDFSLEWPFLNVPLGGDAEFGGVPSIEFNNVGVDLGSFLSDFAGPILEKLKVVMDPLRPAVDALQTRVPVLSDIPPAVALLNSIQPNDEITVVELATHVSQAAGGEQEEDNGKSIEKYILQFLKVYELLDKINAVANPGPGENLVIDLGSFALPSDQDIRLANSLRDISIGDGDWTSAIGGLLEQIPGAGDEGSFANKALDFFSSLDVTLPTGGGGGELGSGGQFEFPLFDEPLLAANLLLGRDVDIARYNMDPLSVSFDFNAFFGFFIGVEIAGHAGLTADLDFGFDTRGIRDFVDSKNPLDIFNGFYIDDRDAAGFDRPEFNLTAALNLAAAVDLFVARASVGGGIFANLDGNLNDVDNDGKFRIDDLLLTFPQCMLDLSGELTAEAFGKVTVGVGGIGVTKRWDLAKATLASFEYACEGLLDPVLATDMGDGELRLNMGPAAGARINGELDGDEDEAFRVTHVSGSPGNETVLVSAFGYEQEYTGVSFITADGGGGDDEIEIAAEVSAATFLHGGSGDDVLLAGGGPATLQGGAGADELVGGPGHDVLHGDGGDDLLMGGLGNDILNGDAGEDTLYGEDGNDRLAGGSEDDLLYGGGGNDEMSGGQGNDGLEGGEGNDILRGDAGNDVLNAGDGDDTAFGGAGDDEFLGGQGNDVARLEAGRDTAFGGPGDDDLDGGTGDDELHGEDGDDLLRGNAGADVIVGDAGNDELHGGSGNDQIEGGVGNDNAYGDSGDDQILGQAGNDSLNGGADDDILEGDLGNDLIDGESGHDLLYGGPGADDLRGGSGQDQMWGDDGADVMAGGPGIDTLYGGDGDDQMDGNDGDDELYGEDGADMMDGGAGRDILLGAQAGDTLHGGPDSDLLIGDAGADRLFGGWGNDIIFGHLIGDQSSTAGEYIEGGPDDDFICGTHGVDHIIGGTADEGFDNYIDPPVVPAALPGGFSIVSCSSNDAPLADFEYAPEPDDLEPFPPAEIRGRVYNDVNGNGLDNPDGIADVDAIDFREPALGGFLVYIDLNGNGVHEGAEPFAVANFQGHYAITGLLPGTYTVRQLAQPGFALTQPQAGSYEIDVAWGDAVEQINFGNAAFGGISGSIWVDVNNDSYWDGAETWQSGVAVYLDYNADGQWDAGAEPQTTTGGGGNYEFADVAPGSYIVRQLVDDGFIQTYPEAHQPHFVSVFPGLTTANRNFGNFENYEISGVKWSDTNGNGTRERSEPGLPGVTIYVDLNQNGVLDDGEPSAVTEEDHPGTTDVDETGSYTIKQVPRGVHEVREVLPAGYRQSHPKPDPADPLSGYHPAAAFEQREIDDLDFGNQPLAEIHGSIWNDVNGNGGWDETETGLGGVQIYLDQNDNHLFDPGEPSTITQLDIASTAEDESGRYSFTELAMGTYIVREVAPAGFTQSYPNSFDHKFEFVEPGFVEFVNFGNFQHATVAGFVWNDANGNGQQDPREPGLPGVVIYSDVNRNGRRDGSEPWTTTVGQRGTYSLPGLAPGEHRIRQEVPFRYGQTAPLNESDGQLETWHSVTVVAGQLVTDQVFGREPRLGDVTGVVWNDVNRNGVRDAGEPGLANATVYIDLNGNDLRDPTELATFTRADDPETIPDEGGTYEFIGLEAGTYTLRQATTADITSPRSAEHVVEVMALGVSTGADFGNGGSTIIVPPSRLSVQDVPPTSDTQSRQAVAAEDSPNASQLHGVVGETLDPHFSASSDEASSQDRVADDSVASAAARVATIQDLPPVAMGATRNVGDAVTVIDDSQQTSTAAAATAELDFGDLPAPFPTTLVDNGPRHAIDREQGPLLGKTVDAEADGLPDADAEGDDLRDQRDEDGIRFVTPLHKGQTAILVADVVGTVDQKLLLNGWLDANGDGNWNEVEEHLFVDLAVGPGANVLNFSVPTTNDPATPTEHAAFRFRLSSQPGLTFQGAASDGEVEDYQVEIGGAQTPPPDVSVSVGDAFLVEGNAGNTLMAFQVSLSHAVDHPVMVAFMTQPGTATPDVDYLATEGFVIIPAGATSSIAEVPVVGDLLFEPHETFTVVLTGATAALLGDSEAVGTIENDDSPSSTGDVRGFKWLDLSNDGLRDGDEPGLADFTIYADLNGNQQRDIGEPYTQTMADDPATPADETGRYLLSGVPAGTVDIREEVPEGWTQTAPVSGAHEVTLAGGATVTDADFGNIVRLPDGDDLIYAGDAADRVFGDNRVTRPNVISVGTRQDTIYGEGGNDRLDGQERDDLLAGGEGLDNIDGGEDVDRVWQMVDADQVLTNGLLTGQGPDVLANIEHATLIGGSSDNEINAQAFGLGSVLLIGLDGNDRLVGTDFDDELIGGNGSDEIEGRAGNDRYVFEPVTTGAPEVDTLVEVADQQTDILDFASLPAGDPLVVDLSAVASPLFGSHQQRELQVGVAQFGVEPSFHEVRGGQGNDVLIGNSDDNLLVGNDGNDQIDGHFGDDMLDGSAGDDHFVFGENWGSDQVADSGGVDHADFSAISQDLLVNIGPMSVTDEVNLLIDPGDAIERVTTGTGNDQFTFLHNLAQLALGTGIVDGGPGQDSLHYDNLTDGVVVDLSAHTATGVTTVENIENVTGGHGDDALVGDELANVLDGAGGNDAIVGLGGDDQLLGGTGDDNLEGGAGNDQLDGNEDHDVLDGGFDSDELRGGVGNDTYLFGGSVPGESDTIFETDSVGFDTIQLVGNGTAVHIDMTQPLWMTSAESGRDLTVALDDAGATNIEAVFGTDAADTFVLQGTDILIGGGLGDDAYVFPDGAVGSYTLSEFADGGTDTVDFSQFTTSIAFDLSLANHAPAPGLSVVTLVADQFEILLGGEADDLLAGNLSANQIFGNAGDDVITLSAGADLAVGGLGDDIYTFVTATTDATIDEQGDLIGSDTLDFSGVANQLAVDLDSTLAQVIATGATLQLIGSVENYIGTTQADVIRIDLSQQPRQVEGNHGNDTMFVDGMGALMLLGVGEITAAGFAPITYSSIETIFRSGGIELAPLAGDADGDGEVAFPDFLRLAANFGKTNTLPSDGDFNDDGEISFADFLILADNFGKQQMAQEFVPSAGDADGDGEVGFSDFLRLADRFGAIDAIWADGDFNLDGTLTFVDFLILADNFGRKQSAPATS